MHWWPSASGRRKKMGKKEGGIFLSFSSLLLRCFHLAANIQWSEMNGLRAQLAVLVRGFLQLCDRSNGVGILAELVFHHSCCSFLMLCGFFLFLFFAILASQQSWLSLSSPRFLFFVPGTSQSILQRPTFFSVWEGADGVCEYTRASGFAAV